MGTRQPSPHTALLITCSELERCRVAVGKPKGSSRDYNSLRRKRKGPRKRRETVQGKEVHLILSFQESGRQGTDLLKQPGMQKQGSRQEAGDMLMGNTSSLGEGALNHKLMSFCTHLLGPRLGEHACFHLQSSKDGLASRGR